MSPMPAKGNGLGIIFTKCKYTGRLIYIRVSLLLATRRLSTALGLDSSWRRSGRSNCPQNIRIQTQTPESREHARTPERAAPIDYIPSTSTIYYLRQAKIPVHPLRLLWACRGPISHPTTARIIHSSTLPACLPVHAAKPLLLI